MHVSVAGVSDKGRVRSRNEDRFLAKVPMIAVADGMGGHLVGDRAAELMIAALERRDWVPMDLDAVEVTLQECVDEACSQILEYIGEAVDPDTDTRVGSHPGAGTTVAGSVYVEQSNAFVIFHVGDSRVYILRKGRLTRLTRDHSLVQKMIDAGEITEQEARSHPKRSVITCAVGTYGPTKCFVTIIEANPGDVVLACTDGLTDELDDDALLSVIADVAEDDDSGSLDALAFGMRDVALTRGGHDNVTVALMRIEVDQ